MRYLTLTHNDNVPWADSATDEPVLGGLSDFGREVVAEMNRIGMLVDLSHVSADVMRQALDVSTVPVVFSHSSARAVCDHPRNVPDDVLARLADNGGVCMVTFVPKFVSRPARLVAGATLARAGVERRRRGRASRGYAERTRPRSTLDDVVAHVEHVREVAGIEHVGLGGDYDGVGGLPEGLEDVTGYPRLLAALADRGWSDEDLAGLTCRNVLRAMGDAGLTAAGRPRGHRVTQVAPTTWRRPPAWRCTAGGNTLRIGVPKEVKNHEYRVAITPIGVHELVAHGHEVFVEKDAGVGSQIDDAEYVAAGRHDHRLGRRRVGRGRDGAQGQGAGRRGVPPDARGPGAVHLPAPRRRPAADRGAGEAQGHRHRLRDRAAALGVAAAALPDVGGRRLPGAAGRAPTR